MKDRGQDHNGNKNEKHCREFFYLITKFRKSSTGYSSSMSEEPIRKLMVTMTATPSQGLSQTIEPYNYVLPIVTTRDITRQFMTFIHIR